MKQLALVFLAFAPFVAQAQATASAPVVKPDAKEMLLTLPGPPGPGQRGTVMTDIHATPVEPKAGSAAKSAAPVDKTAAFPSIPAAGAASSSAAPAPAGGTASAPTSAPAPTAAASDPVAPVKTYATLSDAAKAGVDPLNELQELKSAVKEALPEIVPVFDWRNPQSYLDWVKAHQALALKYGLGVLVAALAAGLFMRPRKVVG